MDERPLRDGLETTLKKVAKVIRKRVKAVRPPKVLEAPLKQSIEVVHNAVAFGSEIVHKKSGRKKSGARKARTKPTRARKTSARKTSTAKRGVKKTSRKRGAVKKSR
jgi:predicted metal-dependent RNase